jgi:hypothetical protein
LLAEASILPQGTRRRVASAAWMAFEAGFLTLGVPVAICVRLNQGSPMPSLAKLTRPKLHRAVPRERLSAPKLPEGFACLKAH